MPSANISSGLSPVNAFDVSEEFKKKLKIVINGGNSKYGIESYCYRFNWNTKNSKTWINMSSNEIKRFLKTNISRKKSKIKSPGMLKKHYSPGIPVINQKKPKNSSQAFIVFGKKFKNFKNYFNLSKKGNLKEAAANLYKTMRKIKKKVIKKYLFPEFLKME